MIRTIRIYLLLTVRWLFRLSGGFHKSEHGEILHKALCKAEVETASLRLYKHNMDQRHPMLCRMIDDLQEGRK